MANPIIKLENVRVVYEKGRTSEMIALKGVSLEIYPEEYIIFFGPSGCGKSTLLYTIAGLEVPDSGVVNVFGSNLLAMTTKEAVNYHRSRMGMVFQAFYLIPSLTILDNIVLPQMFLRESAANRRKRGMEVLERFEIAHLAKRLPSELSGGQQQRVAICRAVINNPPLMFADEPVGNLDSKSSDKVMDLLLQLNRKEKKTVILVTHDPRFLHYAHRIFYLSDGQLVREVSNPERAQMREEKVKPFAARALEDFARFYPHLDEASLKAKFMAHYLLAIRDESVQERLEGLIRKFFYGQLSKQAFLYEANKSFAIGGAGLYAQTAEHSADQIEMILQEAHRLQDTFREFPKSYAVLRRGIDHTREMILDGYNGHLTDEQSKQLDAVLKARLEGSIDHREFHRLLHAPLKDGGVGLHSATADNFSTRLELLLVEYPKEAPAEEADPLAPVEEMQAPADTTTIPASSNSPVPAVSPVAAPPPSEPVQVPATPPAPPEVTAVLVPPKTADTPTNSEAPHL